MWARGFEQSLVAQSRLDVLRHAVCRIRLPFDRIPQVMRNELEQQALGRWPGQGAAGCGQAPGLEIAEIGGQGPHRVVAHALGRQVLQRLDIAVGGDRGELVAAVERQDGIERVELLRAL